MNPGDLVGERFELRALVGRGGMGEVWRARDRADGGTVAVKLMRFESERGAQRFAREAGVLGSLQHPGIVRYVAHGASGAGERYLAMEWLEGEDLAARLARERLTIGESVEVARRVAEALAVAHAHQVVHRDVKPSNVFLVGGQADGVRVLDFGIARRLGAQDGAPTGTGIAIGTVGYMAPEQARGAGSVDARADVFALGCVLYECVAGRAAFEGGHAVAVLMKVLLDEPPRLADARPDAPASLDALVGRTLSKEPSGRPANGAALARELAALDLGALPAEHGAARLRPPALGRGEQRLMTIVLAKGALAAAAGTDATVSAAGPTDASAPAEAPTVESRTGALAEAVRSAAAQGARVESLADGSVIAVVRGAGAVTDLAARAARVALALRRALPGAPMSMATGGGDEAGRLPAGEVAERAAILVGAARPGGGVRLDDVSAGLLDLRFHVSGDDSGLELVRERAQPSAARTLLGRPAPFVGRERPMAVLAGLYDECVAESVARAALLLGPAGIGKSRLGHEFLGRLAAHATPPQVWVGRADERGRGGAFDLLRASIRDAAGIHEDEPIALQLQKLRARVARNVAADSRERVAVFLAEMIGAPSPDGGDVALAAARDDALLMGDQMRTAWQDFLRAEAGAGPVVLVLEDLHWGDLPTVKLLDLALRNVADRPWMVLATARPEVREVFPELWTERALHEVRLDPLSPRAGASLVRAVLGETLSAERVARIVSLAEGNALGLEEFVRAAAAGSTADVPASVTAMAMARLGALDEEARRLLRAASVFGQVFWAGAVARLLGAPAAGEVARWLGWLEEREVLESRGEGRFAGEREYAFRHVVAAEAAYAMLTDADRALGHRLAGEWLEEAGERSAVVVATHYETGGARERAAPWFLRAADQALDAGDLAGAIARAERAVACGAHGAELGAARWTQARAHAWRNEGDVQRLRAEQALALLPARTDRAWGALGLAVSAAALAGDRDAALAHVARIRTALAEPGPPAALLAAAARAANASFNFGEFETAERLLAALAALEASGAASSPESRGRAARARGRAALRAGAVATNLALVEAALRGWEEAGDARQVCSTRVDLSYALIVLGEYPRAEAELRAALSEAERLGLANVSAYARHNLGSVLQRLGRLDEAEAFEREALDAFTRGGNRRLEGGSRVYLASILLAKGDPAAAEREARRAVEELAAAPALRPAAQAVLANVLLARSPQEALAVAADAVRAVEPGGVWDAEAEIRLVHAESLHACGDTDRAREAIHVARRRVLEQAARIPAGPVRDGFLAHVPAHARTLSLARAWLGGD